MNPIYAWTLQSPNATVWTPSITVEGIVSFVSGGTLITSTPPVFRGAFGTVWTPSISNAGEVTIEQTLNIGQQWAWKIDPDLRRWYFDVDVGGLASVESVALDGSDEGIMIKNRVRETTATTGTGTLSLAGPMAGFRSFVDGFGTGRACYYVLVDGSAWEIGQGLVTSGSPDTLQRVSVLDSSAAGAKLSLGTGEKIVFNDAPTNYFKALQGLSLIGGRY